MRQVIKMRRRSPRSVFPMLVPALAVLLASVVPAGAQSSADDIIKALRPHGAFDSTTRGLRGDPPSPPPVTTNSPSTSPAPHRTARAASPAPTAQPSAQTG